MAINFFKKKQDTFDYEQERICKNCAYEYKGRFCCRCGQKVVEPNERTVSHFLGHIFNTFTFVDSKLGNSLKSMIVSPGVPIFFYFVIRGIKTFYGVSWFNSLIKSFISFLALVASVELYRLMVFTLTMLSL